MSDISPTADWFFPGNVDLDDGSPCVVDFESGRTICAVIDDGYDEDEVEAHAQLIASAPTLLRALQVLYRFSVPDGSGELADAIQGAAAAINAAGFGVDPK